MGKHLEQALPSVYTLTGKLDNNKYVTLFWKTIHLGTCKICGNSQLKISVIF